MSQNYPVIGLLSEVTRWPEREMPQERFDRDIAEAMNQMSDMVNQLNRELIPDVNTITANFQTDVAKMNSYLQETNSGVSEMTREMESLRGSVATVSDYANRLGSSLKVLTDTVGEIQDRMENLIIRQGERGELAGSELAVQWNGSNEIRIDSPDSIDIAGTGGMMTLTFQEGEKARRAIKVICLTAVSDTTLNIEGGMWSGEEEYQNWGRTGSVLVLVAHFISGKVILKVSDNLAGL